jgi:cell division protein FtsB
MASTTLRRLVPSRSRKAEEADLETLKQLHTKLVNERQQLRSNDAPAEELERNRLAIVSCQWELSRALIDRYLHPAATASAA